MVEEGLAEEETDPGLSSTTSIQPLTERRLNALWLEGWVDDTVAEVLDDFQYGVVVPVLSDEAVEAAAMAATLIGDAVEQVATEASLEDLEGGGPAQDEDDQGQNRDEPEPEPEPERGVGTEGDVEEEEEDEEEGEHGEEEAAEASLDEGLLPPLTLAAMDDGWIDASDERRENARWVSEMLMEIADGVERIVDRTREFLGGQGSRHDNWGTSREDDEFVTGSRVNQQWHGIGEHVADDGIGMAPMVTVRQFREHRINSIG